MPLIALNILETKLKELLLILKNLKNENERLKKELQKQSEQKISPEILIEMEKLKNEIDKYKKERVVLITKLSSLIEKMNTLIEKEDKK